MHSVNTLSTANVPDCWKFTADQIETLMDSCSSGLTHDKISIFSLRPPQLLFVDDVRSYFRWFIREKTKKSLLNYDLPRPWMDGTGMLVKLRIHAKETFLSFAQQCISDPHFPGVYQTVQDCIDVVVANNPLYMFMSLEEALPIIVFSEVSPSNVLSFLSHILLSMGRFETELTLFKQFSMRKAFALARLIPDADNVSESDINCLMRKYVLEESIGKPGGSRTEDRKLIDGYRIFHSLLIKGAIEFDEVPSVYHHTMQEEVTTKYADFCEEQKKLLIATLKDTCGPFIPSVELLHSATRENQLSWYPTVTGAQGQTVESVLEQKRIIEHVIHAVDLYRYGQLNFTPFQCLIGPPGVGKTFLTSLILSYCIAKGLNTVVTALAGETAARSGGVYLCNLFHIPASKSINNMAPSQLAESAVQKLQFDYTRQTLLKSLDVVCVEELGMISVEYFIAIDSILRHVRESDLPFGGVFVIANGDALQLPPPSGGPIWISTAALVLYHFHFLNEFVRMVDIEGQKLLRILSKRPLSEEEAIEACGILNRCCRFVTTFDEVPRHVVRIFGTRAAEAAEIAKHKDEVRSSNVNCLTLCCEDEILCGTVWKKTSNTNTGLDRVALEPKELLCYEGALMRFTACAFNHRQSQGQLCVVEKLPTDLYTPIKVLAAPSGVRSIPSTVPQVLLQQGFYRTEVSFRTGHSHKIGTIYFSHILKCILK